MHARTKDQWPILGIIDIGAPSRLATGNTSAQPDQCQALVAELALGVDGINLITRFIATKEAPAYDNVTRPLTPTLSVRREGAKHQWKKDPSR